VGTAVSVASGVALVPALVVAGAQAKERRRSAQNAIEKSRYIKGAPFDSAHNRL